MHEVSLVRNVFKTLEDEFEPEEIDRIHTVRMKIGELSNVEPVLMQNAFEAVKMDQPIYKNITLEIDYIPTTVSCHICTATTRIYNYKFICSNCGAPTNNVITGNELLIHQVEFQDQLV
ncbi:MAG: hydrogenase maturation nickel metallochaperone HypA [Ekhidna sp.]|nr:hydrogenase maturation nickel metallochaperone HypA [Ekhidna sp.]